MSGRQTAHCRLCAKLKDYSKLQDLRDDENKRTKALEMLSRLGLQVNLDLTDDTLPKTVCLVCIDSLEKSFNFVSMVEKAQLELSTYLSVPKVKSEVETSEDIFENPADNLEFSFETPAQTCNVSVKEEFSEGKIDIYIEPVPQVSKKKERKKDKKKIDLQVSQVKLTWKDYNWMCAYCDILFANFEELNAHSVQYHEVCNAYRCTDCNRRKYKLDTFIIHVGNHRKHLKFSCYKCHTIFQKPRDCLAHRKSHLESVHHCDGCNACFNNNEELTKHILMYSRGKKPRDTKLKPTPDNLTCKHCKKTFKKRSKLASHLLTHTERIREYTCEICGKCFFNKHNLGSHMLYHDDSRPYQCEICKHRFRKKYLLQKHVGVHSAAKPFSCEQCGRQFRLERYLTAHKIVHTDSLPYVCTVCNKGFRFRTILNQHSRQHTGVKPYTCKICERDFTNWPNYNKHMKTRHGVDTSRRKRDAQDFFSVNPITGEVIKEPQTEKTLESTETVLDSATKESPKREREISED